MGVSCVFLKRLLFPAVLAFVLLVLVPLAAAAQAAGTITVKLDGRILSFDTSPQIVQGRVLVPLRGIFEALGVHLQWQGETKTIIGTKGNTTIVLRVGMREALVNTDKIVLDVPAQVIRGRTLVPLRFIAESLHTYVSWDGERKVVRISTRAEQPPTGRPVAEGNYDPSRRLELVARINPRVDFKVVLEPGALVKAAPVRLYADSAYSYRLVADADVIAASIPGKRGFEGARIKAVFIQKWPFDLKRPVILANGELIDNKCFITQETITSGVRVVERDTSLKVVEASDAQWGQVEIGY